MNLPDSEKIHDILKFCAGKFILPRFQALKDHEISSKSGSRDLVTQADLDVEEYLTEILPQILPGSVVIGEEGVSRGITSLDILEDKAQPAWVVDPVDGTYNFVHGRTEFGIMLACVIGGETVSGWIYDVPEGAVIWAQKGKGAYKNDVPLRLKPCESLQDMTVHINPRYFPKRYKTGLADFSKNFNKAYSVGSASHEYMRIACGRAHGAVYCKGRPWDHLPGALIVQEAGGYAAKPDGKPYRPTDNGKSVIAATSEKAWKDIHDLLQRYITL